MLKMTDEERNVLVEQSMEKNKKVVLRKEP